MKRSFFSYFAAMLLFVICATVSGVFALWNYALPHVSAQQEDLKMMLNTFYYDIVISDVSLVSKTMSEETSVRNDLTSLSSSFTGKNNQTAVYQITATNFSKTTYVYTGATVSSGAIKVATSLDASNQSKLPSASSAVHTSGTPIAPGDTFTFYATYTLTANASAAKAVVNYNFVPVIYTVTYMDNNIIYAIDCITNNTSAAYTVRTDYPPTSESGVRFEYWMNASGLKVTSFPVGNTHDYTLNAKWNNLYSIIFIDNDGEVIYQEHITKETTALSSNGKAIVDAKILELQAAITEPDVTVKWNDYSFGKAADIIVRPEYAYAGALKLVPVYDEGGTDDGILDYYRVEPLDTLEGSAFKNIVIPGKVGGAPVKIVNRVTNEAGSGDWNNFNDSIESIRVGEGTERLEHNSLSYTPKLKTVYLPSTLTYIGKNAFSRNTTSDFKSPIIYYNGTMADWEALIAKSDDDWDGGLDNNTTIVCSDGYYVATTRKLVVILNRTWKKHAHTYGTSCPSGCPKSAPF